MHPSRFCWLALSCLWSLACTNTPNTPAPTDAAGAVDRPVIKDGSMRTDLKIEDSGPQCKWPTTLDNGATGGCVPTRAYVTCTTPSSSSSYAASDPMGCLDCAGTCQDSCTVSEFSLSCAGPQPDAATSSDATYGCRLALSFSSGSVVYCCPCQ
jgi:hypothetical protein